MRIARLAGLVFALLTLSLRAAGAAYEWKNVAIKGGGFVTGLAYHPTEQGLLYARTDVGGAYRWQPASGQWLPLNDDLGRADSQLTGVLSIGLDARDPERLYLACGQYLAWWAQNAAILRSTDRGVTWSRTTLPVKLGGNSDGRSTGERLQVDPNQGAILLLGTNQDGLWKSSDHAATWSGVTTFTPTSTTFVLFDARSGSVGTATPHVYVGVNSTTAAAVYRSTDAGATWAAVPGQPTGLIPHHARLSSDGVLYLAYSNGLGPNGVTSGAVWKLNTATDVWTNITPPTGQGGFAGVALDAQHPGTVVVTTLDRWWPADEIYRSTDGGTTWKALGALSVRDHSGAPYAAASTPHWLGDIEIDPFDGSRCYYVTGYGVYGTDVLSAADTNSSITWSFRNDGLEETVPLGLVSPPAGAPLVSVVGDVDGFRHDDLTVSPARGRHTPRVGTNRSIDFAEAAPEFMVRTHDGGTQRGSRSTDGGATWTPFAAAPTAASANNEGHIALSADGARMVWAPDGAALYASADQGGSWTASTGGPAATSGTSYRPVADRVNAAKFYVYDPNGGLVYVSTSGGASFAAAAANLPTGAETLRATPGQEGHLWLPASGSGLYRSKDAGATFTVVPGVEQAYQIGFGRAAPGRSYPALYLWARVNGTVGFYRSDDEAATWTRINDDAHQFGWINAITGDPRVYGRVYLATGGRGIIYGEPAAASVTLAWSTPPVQTPLEGESVTLTIVATGTPEPTLQWKHNGVALPGATGESLSLSNAQSATAGVYTVTATIGQSSSESSATIVGLNTPARVSGGGREAGSNIRHPNGNVFDQVLLTGAAETITADYANNKITRTSFIDLDGDIVQVEFAGPGTLSLVLAEPSGPATPELYHQPDVEYMKGHAGIVITGADERTHVGVFTVGRATAFDRDGGFNILQSISATNDPLNNRSTLFTGHASTVYDGFADIAFIAIASTNGKFGSVRTANATYFAAQGYTGLYAPGVEFQGPVYLGDVSAYGSAVPVIVVGSAEVTSITGGDLFQENHAAVQVKGLTQLRFVDGSDSHGRLQTAQANRAVLEEDGRDVTAEVVVNPGP